MLEIRDLSVAFTGKPGALRGIDLHVSGAEIVALSGEPGAGKSTLARCVAGEIAPSRGTISVAGRRLSGRSRRPDRHGVAVVWQDLALCDTLDVAANLMLGREHQVGRDARFHARAAQELAGLGIPIRDTHQSVSTLTLGQRWLLALAMALGRRPRVLILDELTTSIGALANATVERLLQDARAQGIAVLLITRDVDQMFRVADRIVVLTQGRRVAEFDPAVDHRDDVAALLGEEAAVAHREAAALRRTQELQRQFLSRLSHELRTPLTAIRGYATSLAAPDVIWDGASEQRFLERIATESARLGRLVDDMLDFSAIESGVMRLQPDWCDLRLVLDAALNLLPAEQSAAVSVDADADLPVIWADHDRLEQVIVNLVANAFKHNPPGTEVRIALHGSSPDELTITVADTGPGFAFELGSDPFDSSGRPRSSTSGSGLGLSIARGIIEVHGGDIALASSSAGSCFTITLPVEIGPLAGELDDGILTSGPAEAAGLGVSG